jgi:hypothetical protein
MMENTARCAREIKFRNAMAEATFNKNFFPPQGNWT